MEDEERQGTEGANWFESQRHIPLVSLLLWHKIILFIASFGLSACNRGQ